MSQRRADFNPRSATKGREAALSLLNLTYNNDFINDDGYNDSHSYHVDCDVTIKRQYQLEQQIKLCSELLHVLLDDSVKSAERGGDKENSCQSMGNINVEDFGNTDANEAQFIRTNMLDYNNKHTPRQNSKKNIINSQQKIMFNHSNSIRNTLGMIPSSSMSRLAQTLSDLITYRVSTSSLLPATQDEEANAEILNSLVSKSNKTAMTISRIGMVAARTYAEIVGKTGAWGAGLVDIGAVSGLSALIRRWSVECRGRESCAWSNSCNARSSNITGYESDEDYEDIDHSDEKNESRQGETKCCGMKRRREVKRKVGQDKKRNVSNRTSQHHQVKFDLSCRNDSESEFIDMMGNSLSDIGRGSAGTKFKHHDPEKLSEREMIISGLQLSSSLAKATQLVEFGNWSSEARESFIDASISALATAAALLACYKSTDSARSQFNNSSSQGVTFASLCQDVVTLLSHSIQTCVLSYRLRSKLDNGSVLNKTPFNQRRSSLSRQDQENEVFEQFSSSNSEMNTKIHHETVVFVLRGLFPLLTCQVDLPGGSSGRLAAHEAATCVVEGITKQTSEDIVRTTRICASSSRHIQRRTPKRTPRRTPKRTPNSRSPLLRTPRLLKPSKDGGVTDPTSILPPSLKKSVTPKRSLRKSNAGSKSKSNDGFDYGIRHEIPVALLQPRKILNALIGMMQRLATSKGLGKADARTRAVFVVKRCLTQLPVEERSQFLQFITQLCQSKVSSHRLFGVELAGDILLMGFIWEDHYIKLEERSKNNTGYFVSNSVERCTESTKKQDIDHNDQCIPLFILTAISKRVSDSVPTVRARAAQIVSNTLQITLGEGSTSLDNQAKRRFRDSLEKVKPELILSLRNRASSDNKAPVRRAAILAWVRILHLSASSYNSQSSGFSGEISSNYSRSDVSVLCEICSDPSLSVRKSAAEALTSLLQKQPRHGSESSEIGILEEAWANAVLPLVLDIEPTCVAKVVEAFITVVIDPILEAEGAECGELSPSLQNRCMAAWKILYHVSQASHEAGAAKSGERSLRIALRKMFESQSYSPRKVLRPLLKELYRIAKCILDCGDWRCSEIPMKDVAFQYAQQVGSWCLLEALSDCSQSRSRIFSRNPESCEKSEQFDFKEIVEIGTIDPGVLVLCWEKMYKLSSEAEIGSVQRTSLIATARSCLCIISKFAPFVSLVEAEQVASSLLKLLSSFDLCPDLVVTVISTLVMLTGRVCTKTQSTGGIREACLEWINETLLKCEGKLSDFVENRCIYSSKVESAIFIVGELLMVGFSTKEKTDLDTKNAVSPISKDLVSSDAVHGLFPEPSKNLVYLIQVLILPTLPVVRVEHCERKSNPHVARAHAFVTLGKICLRDERIARKSLNLFARELNQNPEHSSPAVKNNALLVLGDLCVKYTNLVDRFLPIMASCLQSGSGQIISTSKGLDVVRKHSILLLSSLLLQDYIKWRGFLFRRFLLALVDSNESVSKLAMLSLCGPLLTKQPNLFFNNFIETIFVFNGCTAHSIYTTSDVVLKIVDSGDSEFEDLNLSGFNGKKKRMEIYTILISRMTDEEKIGITARITKEVLGTAVESSGDLNDVCKQPAHALFTSKRESARNVLSDCFAILTSPILQIGKASRKYDDDDDDEVNQSASETGTSGTQLSVVKGKLLSKISRKHLIETVVPILNSLKSILEKSCSPLLKDLMLYMVEIFRQYKEEVREVLATDITLLQELDYEYRMCLKEKKSNNQKIKRDNNTNDSIIVDP